ncbi:MAG: DUF2076 domain-containing protein [Alphaproteobacteria bacterium]|nr:DUF2076 domain-containing protein [Alphaproteobacteria bacterium]
MTPQERKLVDELFDRLAALESAPRDEGAVNAINEGLERAPNALYPMVQTVLVQDEALKRADARIRELEAELGIESERPAQQGSFLDGMRDALMGKREPQGSVPTVRPGATRFEPRTADATTDAWGRTVVVPPPGTRPGEAPGYGLGQGPGQAPAQGGGSFLGTAAAAAAGAIGGALLMNSMRDLFGGQQGKQQSAFDQGSGGSGSPWNPSAGDGSLARDAGLGDIGGGRTAAYDDPGQRTGLFDVAQNDAENLGDDFGDDIDLDGDTA